MSAARSRSWYLQHGAVGAAPSRSPPPASPGSRNSQWPARLAPLISRGGRGRRGLPTGGKLQRAAPVAGRSDKAAVSARRSFQRGGFVLSVAQQQQQQQHMQTPDNIHCCTCTLFRKMCVRGEYFFLSVQGSAPFKSAEMFILGIKSVFCSNQVTHIPLILQPIPDKEVDRGAVALPAGRARQLHRMRVPGRA